MKSRLPEIDRLRGLAILLVLTVHIPLNALVPPFVDGQTGVDLFFVISGFVVALSLFQKLPASDSTEPWLVRLRKSRTALGHFYIRRVFRILPLAVLAAAVILGLTTAIHDQGFMNGPRVVLGELVSFFTLTYNYAITQGAPLDIVHFWSLNVEEHFYLLLPLFLILVQGEKARIALLGTGAFFLVVTVFRMLIPHTTDPYIIWRFLNFSSHTRFDGLLLGVLIAVLYQRGYFRNAKPDGGNKTVGTVLSLAAIAVLAAIRHQFEGPPVVLVGHLVATGASSVLVLIAAYGENMILPASGVRQTFEFLGARAYPLYLLHHPLGRAAQFVLHPAFAAWGRAGDALFFIVLLLSIFGIVELCHRLIELPMIRFSKRLTTFQFQP